MGGAGSVDASTTMSPKRSCALLGSARRISTRAGSLGGKRGAPMSCLVVASTVAQEARVQAKIASSVIRTATVEITRVRRALDRVFKSVPILNTSMPSEPALPTAGPTWDVGLMAVVGNNAFPETT